MRRRLLDFGVTLGVVGLDQATKALVFMAGPESFPIPVIPGFFRLTFVDNRGGVFGMFNTIGEPWHTLLLIGVPVVAVGLLSYLLWRTSPGDRLTRMGLALVLGGAVGNQIDRLRLGYVLDYLDFYLEGAAGDWLLRTFGQNHWYNFNVADMAICTGAGLLLIDALSQSRRARRGKGARARG
jgi:signal peptidase II